MSLDLDTTVSITRASLASDLVAAGVTVVAAGLSPGSSGNLSVRATDGTILITPGGAVLGSLDAERLAVLDADGEWIGGDKPSKEAALHLALYRKNPEHRAIVHVHSPQAVAASCLEPWAPNSALPPITPYFVMRAGQTPLVPYRAPGSPELGELLSGLSFPFHAALLQNHGQLTSGRNLADAIDAAVEVEEASRITLITTGKERRLLDEREIADLTERYGSSWTPVNR
ncbi:L-fuculose-phosphate aldolase [Plantibacter flavus]|uniref:L-fuculose-phosphate aldolase n=1 Tax=Plantibacter flavus TaxID=150123 RepID=A0A3N2C2K5_9MICO|nr:class II aldolase/adducin family protein [Plantibacter flavus]ROR81709.1 L-fuculose-phosphate aldolase [Plantibacter flavus]SMG15850.1 L-fuculose-phosphate aldolase [Plantibacter flavus]